MSDPQTPRRLRFPSMAIWRWGWRRMAVFLVIFLIALYPISPAPISYVLIRTEQYGLTSVRVLSAVYAPVTRLTKGNAAYAMFCYWQHKSLERAFGRAGGYPGFLFDDAAIKTIRDYELKQKRQQRVKN